MIVSHQLCHPTTIFMALLVLLLLKTVAGSTAETSTDPCDSPNHQVLGDRRRSPMYQPKNPRDLICDRLLMEGWYRFQINNRSAEMPTHCAPVNYCGTQAPIWLNLDWPEEPDLQAFSSKNPSQRKLPSVKYEEGNYTLCTAWTVPGLEEDTDCCFLTSPTTIRHCGEFFVYYLRPTVGCHMAYCAEEKGSTEISQARDLIFSWILEEHPAFAFEDVPRIRSVMAEHLIFLNCSVKVTAQVQLRFNWYKVSHTDGSQLKIRSEVQKAQTFDTIARSQLHMGDQVYCEVEALLDLLANHYHVINPSTISEPMALGLRIDPAHLELYEGDVADGTKRHSIRISATVPFLCGPHISPNDCHLTLRFKPRIQDASPFRPPDIALSACTIKFNASNCYEDDCGRAELNIAAIADYFEEGLVSTTVEVSVESYGDPFWHGYKASNITIQVVDQVINQCSAYTSGHIITVQNTLRTVTQAGTFSLYSSLDAQPWRRFEVLAHFRPCPSGPHSDSHSAIDAFCICGIEAQEFGDRFTIDGCETVSQLGTSFKRKYHPNLPQVKLVIRNDTAATLQPTARVWESRKGSLLRILFGSGNQIRIRLEPFGLSVSIFELSRSRKIEGLCHPTGLAWKSRSGSYNLRSNGPSVSPPTGGHPVSKPFCSCSGSGALGKRYTTARMTQTASFPCHPLYEECYSKCKPEASLRFQPLLNYVDITNEVRQREDVSSSLHSNSITARSPELFTWLQLNHSVQGLDELGFDAELKRQRRYRAHAPGPDPHHLSMGHGVHWITAAGPERKRRAAFQEDADEETRDNEILAWESDTSSHYLGETHSSHYFCSNTLVNSTVGVECERHLGDIITLAIDICIADIRLHNSTEWAGYAMGLLEDVCELQVVKNTLHWPKDRSGRLVAPKTIVEILNCPNACSAHGVCLEHGCICQPGFYGQDCGHMEERPPSLAAGQDLCDRRVRNCSVLKVQGQGFIDSSFLTCRYWQGRYHKNKWTRLGAARPSSATWLTLSQVACNLPMNHAELQELAIEIEISNDGRTFSKGVLMTIYNGKCRSCTPATQDSPQPHCTDREDVCYIHDDCFEDREWNPVNSCEACLLESFTEGWSPNSENLPPSVDEATFQIRVYDGQLLRHQLRASDPENGTLSYMLLDALDYVPDIHLTRQGLVEWRAISNALQVTTVEELTVQVTDACNFSTIAQVRIQVLPCPCLHNGQCQEMPQSPHLYICHCLESFTGLLCEERIDHCTPNPCHNAGHCFSTGTAINLTCTCLPPFSGSRCEQRRDPCSEQPCYPGVACTALPFHGFRGNGTTNQLGNRFNVDYVCGSCPLGMQGDGRTCTDTEDCARSPCYPGVTCYDKPAPSTGFYCGTCPLRMTGDGKQCYPLPEREIPAKKKCKKGHCTKKGRKQSRVHGGGLPPHSSTVLPTVSTRSWLIDVVTMETGEEIIYLPDNRSSDNSTANPVRVRVVPYEPSSTTPMPRDVQCELPCENRGKCVFPGVCRCRVGYSGPTCSAQQCRPPCRNGGRCMGRNRCKCLPGTMGTQCELTESTCRPVCQNGGDCLKGNTCSCLKGWTGSRCEIPVCDYPCQNHGLCIRPNKCSCLSGFRGKQCQKPSCKPKCQNNGKCVGPNQCACKANFAGPLCEIFNEMPSGRRPSWI